MTFAVVAAAAAVALSVSVYANVDENDKAVIDYSKSAETGTVTIKLKKGIDTLSKIRIQKGDQVYDYHLKSDGSAEVYPLQMGNGEYSIKVTIEIPGKGYMLALGSTYNHTAKNERSVFLNPSQQINFNKDSKIVKKAAELVKDLKTDLEKAEAIYMYVIDALKYDTDKANKVAKGEIPASYVPLVDEIATAGKGICFDYAVVFAAMLRSQGIPAKLVKGYVPNTSPGAPAGSTIYHAWNEFYSKEQGGWYKVNEMKFDGEKFNRIDPTLESSNKGSKAATQFIGNGSNYAKTSEY
jgi:transglutaminase-like putative cysteine protease